ncbi:MAG: chitobiase/beta-hexosaminidase C-terminal domain-containing protein [Lachnospiraceae bacterium]|nr:chitobiase/beta-hexosaminidase C-terminal domain-containing protein [Lachnospiraceae bacterium]
MKKRLAAIILTAILAVSSLQLPGFGRVVAVAETNEIEEEYPEAEDTADAPEAKNLTGVSEATASENNTDAGEIIEDFSDEALSTAYDGITLDGGGGTFEDGRERIELDSSACEYPERILKYIPEREGFVLRGWKEDGGNSIASYNQSKAKIVLNGNIQKIKPGTTLYPVWKKTHTLTVILDEDEDLSNGGGFAVVDGERVTCVYAHIPDGEGLNHSDNPSVLQRSYSHTNYCCSRFGYCAEAQGTSDSVPETNITPDENGYTGSFSTRSYYNDAVLYAVFRDDSYTITLHDDAGYFEYDSDEEWEKGKYHTLIRRIDGNSDYEWTTTLLGLCHNDDLSLGCRLYYDAAKEHPVTEEKIDLGDLDDAGELDEHDNLDLYVKWGDEDSVLITFDPNGGVFVDNGDDPEDGVYTVSSDPLVMAQLEDNYFTKKPVFMNDPRKTFTGWYSDPKCENLVSEYPEIYLGKLRDDSILVSTTLYAGWTLSRTLITFRASDGCTLSGRDELTGEPVSGRTEMQYTVGKDEGERRLWDGPTVEYEDPHKEFGAWEIGGKRIESADFYETEFKKDTVVTVAKPNTVVRIRVDFGEETASYGGESVASFEDTCVKNEERDPYSYLGGYTENADGTKYIEGFYYDSAFRRRISDEAMYRYVKMTADVTYYARWEDYCVVTFDPGPGKIRGCSTITKKLKKGEILDYCPEGIPQDRANRKEFTGWYTDEECKNRISTGEIKALTVNESMTIHAGYRDLVWITFHRNNSSVAADIDAWVGWGDAVQRTIAVRKGDTLGGYELPGCRCPGENILSSAKDPFEYEVFTGWYKDPDLNDPLDPDHFIAETDTDFYAGWSDEGYHTVTFVNTHPEIGAVYAGSDYFGSGIEWTKVMIPDGTPYRLDGLMTGQTFAFPRIELREEETSAILPTGEWAENADGTGKRWYLDGKKGHFTDEDGRRHSFNTDGFIPDSDMMLYSVWDEPVTVTLHMNGKDPHLDDGDRVLDGTFVYHKADNNFTGTFRKGITYSELNLWDPGQGLRDDNEEAYWGYRDKKCTDRFLPGDILNEDTVIYSYWASPEEVTLMILPGEGAFHGEGISARGYPESRKYWLKQPFKGQVFREKFEIPTVEDERRVFYGLYGIIRDMDKGTASPDMSKPCKLAVYEDGEWYLEADGSAGDKDPAAPANFECIAVFAQANLVTVRAGEYTETKKIAVGREINLSDYDDRTGASVGSYPLGWYYRDEDGKEKRLSVTLSGTGKVLYKPVGDIEIYYKWGVGPADRAELSVDVSGNDGMTLKIGEKRRLSADITPDDTGAEVTWVLSTFTCGSSNKSGECPVILKNDGTVTGKAEGSAVVYAVADGIRSDEVTVTVTDTAAGRSLSLLVNNEAASETPYEILKGDKLKITAEIIPEWLDTELVWTSSDPELLNVTGSASVAYATGGAKAGEAVVTAKTRDGKNSASVKVKVGVPVAFDKHELILSAMEGESAAVNAAVMSAYASDVEYTLTLKNGDPADALMHMAVKEGGEIELTPVSFDLEQSCDLILKGRVSTGGKTYEDECTIRLSAVQGTKAPYCAPYAAPGDERIVEKGQRVTLHSDTAGAKIWYSVNGGDYSVYSEALVITEDTVLSAYAKSGALRKSETVSFTFRLSGDWGEIPEAVRSDIYDSDVSLVPEELWYVIRSEETEKYVRIDEDTEHSGKNAKNAKLTGLSFAYTGSKITLNERLRVFYGKSRLIEGRDYTVSYANNLKAAAESSSKAPCLTVKGKGNYAKTISFRFGIKEAELEETVIDSEKVVAVKSGSRLTSVSPTISYRGKKLSAKKDYALNYYKGTVDEEHLISAAVLKNLKPAAGETYFVEIADRAGGNFAGSPKTETVEVKVYDPGKKVYVPASGLKALNASGKAVKIPYDPDAEPYTADVLFDNRDGREPVITVFSGKTVLTYQRDYTAELSDTAPGSQHDTGKYRFVIHGVAKNEEELSEGEVIVIGNKTASYEITGIPASKVKAAGLSKTAEYSDSPISFADLYDKKESALKKQNAQALSLGREAWDGITLYTTEKEVIKGKKVSVYRKIDESHYDVSMENTGAVGKFNVEFRLKNGYAGTVKKTVTIKPYDLKNDTKEKLTVTVGDTHVFYSKAGARCDDVTVKFDERVLREGVDYTLSYKNNAKAASKDAAKAPTLIVKGKGNFAGSNAGTKFDIEKAPVSNITVAVNDVKYNAKGKKGYFLPAPKFTEGGKKIALGKNKDLNALSKADYTYHYVGTAEMADGTKRENESEVLPADKPLPGTVIRLDVTVSCGAASSYTTEGENLLSCEYRIINSAKDISGAKVKVKDASKLTFRNGMEVVPVKEEDLTVTLKGKKLDPSAYTIREVKNNRFPGTATVVLSGEGEYGGTKSFTFRIGARWLG